MASAAGSSICERGPVTPRLPQSSTWASRNGSRSSDQVRASHSNKVLQKRIFCSLPATTCATSSQSSPCAPGMLSWMVRVVRGLVTWSRPA